MTKTKRIVAIFVTMAVLMFAEYYFIMTLLQPNHATVEFMGQFDDGCLYVEFEGTFDGEFPFFLEE